MMDYAIGHDLMHKLINLSKKNDLFHWDYISKCSTFWLIRTFIVRIYGNEETKSKWKDMLENYQSSKLNIHQMLNSKLYEICIFL
jgi:hypothetical protein